MSLSIAPAASFPGYTVIELALDRVLHLLPAILAIGGVARLLLVTIPVNDARQLLASTIYGTGQVSMFMASAAYNSCPAGRRKELLRRIDHAVIFVMITGDLHALRAVRLARERWSAVLRTGMGRRDGWGRAESGISAPLRATAACAVPRPGMGDVGICRTYAANLSNIALLLLFGGGVAYSAGAVVHAHGRLPFHSVAWHALVLVGASLHWAAVAKQVANWRGVA